MQKKEEYQKIVFRQRRDVSRSTFMHASIFIKSGVIDVAVHRHNCTHTHTPNTHDTISSIASRKGITRADLDVDVAS